MKSLTLLVVTVCVLSLLSSACWSIQPLTGKLYTSDDDFGDGTFFRVSSETTSGQLQFPPLNPDHERNIWILNNDCTLSQIDINTGEEIARHQLAAADECYNLPSGSPIRTAVDSEGNCWVALIAHGTVVKVRPMPNSGGPRPPGPIPAIGDDPYVLFEVVLNEGQYGGTNVQGTYDAGTVPLEYYSYRGFVFASQPMALVVDINDNVWVGTNSTSKYFHINGQTGEIMRSINVPQQLNRDHNPVDAVIDEQGIIWSVTKEWNPTIVRINPSTGSCTGAADSACAWIGGICRYGNDHLFVCDTTACNIRRYRKSDFNSYIQVTNLQEVQDALGIACTSDGDLWVATDSYDFADGVVRLDNDLTTMKAVLTLNGGDFAARGVAVDANGKVWAMGTDSSEVHRIDPATNQVDLTVDIPAINCSEEVREPRIFGHSGHQDMTGVVYRSTFKRRGTWNVTYDSGYENLSWGLLSWTKSTPTGTSIKVRVCSSHDGQTGWSAWENAVHNSPLTATPDGRYLKVEVTFEAPWDGTTPILYSLSVRPYNGYVVTPTTLAVPEHGTNTFQVRLKAPPVSAMTTNILTMGPDADLYPKFGGTLVFTEENWGVAHTVTLSDHDDPDLQNGSATFLVYSAWAKQASVYAAEIDDDVMPYSTSWGTLGSGPGQFSGPTDVCSDTAGYVYVADTLNNRIQKFTQTGRFIQQWSACGEYGQLNQPYGVCVGREGDVFVSDSGNSRVVEFTPDGTYVSHFGTLNLPRGCGADADGNLLVADRGNHRICEYSCTDNGVTHVWSQAASWGSQGTGPDNLQFPWDVCAGGTGGVYVADTGNNRIERLNNGGFIGTWGESGTGPGQYNGPKGVCLDPTFGNLFVSDSGNNRIQSLFGGAFQSQWGTPGASAGQFADPSGLACDPAGSLYVADTGNNRIQRFGWPLGNLRNCPDGPVVTFGPVAVTAVFPTQGWIYVETLDRTAGVRVNATGSLEIGDLVEVRGSVHTDLDSGERYIVAESGSPTSLGGVETLAPLAMRVEWLGGASSGYLKGAQNGFGFNNVGLLAQSWGNVAGADPVNGVFYINDGSNTCDQGESYGARVVLPAGATMPIDGDYVRVTGISTLQGIDGARVRTLMPRPGVASDIQTITTWSFGELPLVEGYNALAVPGIPRSSSPEGIICPCTPAELWLYYVTQRFDAPTQYWQHHGDGCGDMPINILAGEGFTYDHWEPTVSCIRFERTPATGDQFISLPRGTTPGGDMAFICNPFDADRALSACLVTDGCTVMTFPDAVSSGLIHEIQFFNGSVWQAMSPTLGVLQPGRGYFIYPGYDNLALIIPEQQ